MNRYRTENVEIKAEAPKNLANKGAAEIVQYLVEFFKVLEDANGNPAVPANKSTAYMQAVAEAIFDPEDWKRPIYAIHPQCGAEWAKAAIIWFHGAKPHESFCGVFSDGYAC